MSGPDDSAIWDQIESLLDAALDLPAEDRANYVRQAAGDDAALAARVLELLAADAAAAEFLSAPDADDPPPQTDDDHLLGQQIGPWQIQALLGRGGMGAVYRAERNDGRYSQPAALKLIPVPGSLQVARFNNERNILAGLNHPYIASLLDGGLSQQGQPYMAMELVEGLTLDASLRAQPRTLDERLELFLKIASAVQYAHGQLVVHRDLKPGNIMLDDHGLPRLLDFGIAKLTNADRGGEQTQAVATPNYAAPEQLRGQRITVATDVYGLGGVLYYLLCERPPLALDGLSLPQLLERITHRDPQRPSQVCAAEFRPRLSGDLDAICIKALAKEPERRYPSAQALADDVQRHLDRLPVRARPTSWRYRLGRYCRRNALPLSAAGVVVLSIAAAIVGISWQAHQAGLERDAARRDAARLSQMRTAMLQLFRSAASETDTDQMTARELFRLSAQRIDRDFRDDPATATSLLQMLGELHLFTEDYAAARRLLNRAAAYPAEQIPPEILANIRYDLAQLAYRDGNYSNAQHLHDQARQYWEAAPERYRSELIWSSTLASQLARARGEVAAAVRILSRAAVEAENQWGRAHPDTGIVLINLAVAQYYANDLPAALKTCARSWQVWQDIERTESPDALNLLANWGLFALRHGELAEGEKRLQQALELRTKLYGASAAQATLMKNLGVAHRLNGRPAKGMALLEQAEWMARKYAGAGGRLHASAVSALSRALVEEGETDVALSLLKSARSHGAERPFSWQHLNAALLAELSPDPGLAETLFDEALAGLLALGDSALSQTADARFARARWLRARGQAALAHAALREAITDKTRARHDGHHSVLGMRAHLAVWLHQDGQSHAAQALATKLRSRIDATLGPQHARAQAIHSVLAAVPEPAAEATQDADIAS